jgi:hypothetical protein
VIAWSLVVFLGFVVAVIVTQFGDPASEGAHQLQVWSSRIILIAAPAIWLLGCLVILRRKKV